MSIEGEAGRGGAVGEEDLGWVRSSFCTLGDCVEIRISEDSVLIRDSKTFARLPVSLCLSLDDWNGWTASLLDHAAVTRGTFDIHQVRSASGVTLHQGAHSLSFSHAEWMAFRAGVRAGEFATDGRRDLAAAR